MSDGVSNFQIFNTILGGRLKKDRESRQQASTANQSDQEEDSVSSSSSLTRAEPSSRDEVALVRRPPALTERNGDCLPFVDDISLKANAIYTDLGLLQADRALLRGRGRPTHQELRSQVSSAATLYRKP